MAQLELPWPTPWPGDVMRLGLRLLGGAVYVFVPMRGPDGARVDVARVAAHVERAVLARRDAGETWPDQEALTRECARLAEAAVR